MQTSVKFSCIFARFTHITFKLGKFTKFKVVVPAVSMDFRLLAHVKSWKNRGRIYWPLHNLNKYLITALSYMSPIFLPTASMLVDQPQAHPLVFFTFSVTAIDLNLWTKCPRFPVSCCYSTRPQKEYLASFASVFLSELYFWAFLSQNNDL